jgi:RNA polymerase sigma factor (TIGR02999 family)
MLAVPEGPSTTHLAALVKRCESGDAPARASLFAALYGELHRIAKRESRRYGDLPSMGCTTLLHEVFLDLDRSEQRAFADKAHFLGYAARAMRGLVIDHVRSKNTAKRGGGLDITRLDTALADQVAHPEDLQGLSDALDELAALEPALAHVVDLKFFCGFSIAEIAQLTGAAERTVQRQWEKARLLLRQALVG